ncbi:MAG: hypothetical protein K8S97_11515 [Anaerolineae bacterium]|nr:hypothetical protein [Anaerolineae bacterium]
MPPVEAWEKVWINPETYGADFHAYIKCTACHDGNPDGDFETAHVDLILDPSANPQSPCIMCHEEITTAAADSLHNTLAGYDTALYERSAPDYHETLEGMESYHCDSCHATCGDCHISQPNAVGGGLLDGHAFVPTPPMSQTCTACHGSRVKNEYYGLNEGAKGDVHLRQARLACTDCHTSNEMHGMGEFNALTHRYDDPAEPRCEACHADQIGQLSGIPMHLLHGDKLACQVCHSTSYTNCTNCHVERTEDDIAFFTVEDHSLGFYIGRNPLQTEERPYEYVPVRHVPIDPDSFSFYGDDLLPNFLDRATWTHATPHNIQRTTPQTETCGACHGNEEIFLTIDKVDEAERGGANLDVIVEEVPPMFPGMVTPEPPAEDEADDDFF